LTDAPRWLFGLTLIMTFVAEFVDAIGYPSKGQIYLVSMTGNTTR
jgi:uncharacterized membrane protein YoaK (UPF0700 family)